MSFHYYSCRYLPPLPSTHVCLPRGLQWRLDKNSPKINHSIFQPSENNCLYFHQISTLDLTKWLFGVLMWAIHPNQTILERLVHNDWKSRNPFVECPKNSMLGLHLSSWGRSGLTKFLQAIWSIRMGWPIAIRTTKILLQIFQII